MDGQQSASMSERTGLAHVALGSLEGRIEALTVHRAIAFSIYDSTVNRLTPCECSRATLDAAIMHFDKRVSVRGEIRYDARGEVASMKADEVHPLGTGPLPQLKDICGLFADHKIDTEAWAKFVRERW